VSKKFHAERRDTGERWIPEKDRKQYLVMYDSGYLAVITEDFYTYITPLNKSDWVCVKH
jgi:hypothetical protein